MFAPRSFAQLAAVVLVGAAAAALTFITPARPPREEQRPNTCELPVHAGRSGAVELLWDRHAGYAEPDYPKTPLPDAGVPGAVRWAMPAGRFIGLIARFPPGDGTIEVGTAEIRTHDGVRVRSISIQDYGAGKNVVEIQRRSDEAIVRATDPSRPCEILFFLGGELVLDDDSPAGRAQARPVVIRERVLAAVLFAASLWMFGVVVRRRRLARSGAGPAPWLETAALALAATSLLFSRRPDIFALPQFWAEDGTVFFVEQRVLGLAAFAQPYASYLHTIPRLTAGAAGLAPAVWAPAIYLGVSLACALAAVLKAASRRVALPHPYWSALAVVLVPNMGELLLNVTNAQWFGAVIMLLIAIGNAPRGARELAVDLGAVVLFGLSGPFAVFFAPLFAWRWWRDRNGRTATLALTVLAVGAVQIAALAVYPTRRDPGEFSAIEALAAIGQRTGGQLVNIMPAPDGAPPVVWGLVALAGWVALWLALPAAGRMRAAKWPLAFAAAVVLAGGVWRFRAYVVELFEATHTQRYFHLPLLAMIWLSLGALSASRGWRRTVAMLALVVLAVRNIPHHRIFAHVDRDWYALAPAIDRGEPVDIPINPAPWAVVLPPSPPRPNPSANES